MSEIFAVPIVRAVRVVAVREQRVLENRNAVRAPVRFGDGVGELVFERVRGFQPENDACNECIMRTRQR